MRWAPKGCQARRPQPRHPSLCPRSGLRLTGRGDAAGQPVPLRLLLEHELAAGLDAEVFLRLGDVAGRAAASDARGTRRALGRLCHTQQPGQGLQEDLGHEREWYVPRPPPQCAATLSPFAAHKLHLAQMQCQDCAVPVGNSVTLVPTSAPTPRSPL